MAHTHTHTPIYTYIWKSGRHADHLTRFPDPWLSSATYKPCYLFFGQLRSCCTIQSLAFHFFPNSQTLALFLLATSGLFLPCSQPFSFALLLSSSLSPFFPVYVCALCGPRFCVQVRSFNFDLCFRLFCVAFVDFCHLNRNFYFLHVPMTVAPSCGFGCGCGCERGCGCPAAAVASFLCHCFYWTLFFLFINACPWGIANASPANWISFFGHLKLTSVGRGPRTRTSAASAGT